MPPLINRGLIVVGGARNVGKTIFASTILPPAEMGKIVMHDGENSAEEFQARAMAINFEYGIYLNLSEQFEADSDEILGRTLKGKFPWKDENERGAMESYFLRVVQGIKDIPQGKYKVYIHEPADKLEAGVYAYAVAHSGVRQNSRDENFWLEAMYPLYEGIFGLLRPKGIDIIILTAHLKNSSVRRGNKAVTVVNKLELAVKPRLYTTAALMLVLVQDAKNEDGAPAALVLKERLPSVGIDEHGNWKIRRMLPRRIPHCTWRNGDTPRGSIEWYMKNGANLSDPHPDEVWNDDEKSIFGEFLNSAQMRMMVAMEQRDLAAVTQTVASTFDLNTQKKRSDVQSKMDEGMSLDEAIEALVMAAPPPLQERIRGELRAATEGMEE